MRRKRKVCTYVDENFYNMINTEKNKFMKKYNLIKLNLVDYTTIIARRKPAFAKIKFKNVKRKKR